jgi:hypothetical protein
MCIVKTPKVTAGTEKAPEPTVIRNPYLDGLDPQAKALRQGRSSLRVERTGSGAIKRSAPDAAILPPIFPTAPAIFGGQGTSTVQVGGSGGGYIDRSMGRTYER